MVALSSDLYIEFPLLHIQSYKGAQHLVYHEGVTHLLIEGGGEEGDHVCEALEEGRGEVAVVPQHH